MSTLVASIETTRNTTIAVNREYRCDTQVELGTISYTWAIRNFEYCVGEEGKKCIKSPKFPEEPDSKAPWCLRIYPKGIKQGAGDFVSVFLWCGCSDSVRITARCTFSLLNSQMQKAYTLSAAVNEFTKTSPSLGYDRFIQRNILLENMHEFLPNNTLTIFCKIDFVKNIVHTSTKINATNFEVFKLVDDLSQLFENEDRSDFTITVEKKKFKVHKAILGMRSPVFSAMFDANMTEKNMNNVDIPDVEYAVMKELLRFIYTSKVEGIEKVADRLLVAADKYALNDLKLMCEKALQTTVTVNNAADILILADLHNAKALKENTMDFICEHSQFVQNTAGYKSMIRVYPQLLAEAFTALSQRINTVANAGLLSKEAKKMRKS